MSWKVSPITWGTNPTPRRSHLSYVKNDSLFIFGGLLLNGQGLNSNELFYELDFCTLTWTNILTYGDIPNTRYCSRYFSCFDEKEDKIYVIIPSNENSFLHTLDLETLWWDRIPIPNPSADYPVKGCTVVKLKNYIFVNAGENSYNSFINRSLVYDLHSRSWTYHNIEFYPFSSHPHTFKMSDDYFYLFAGERGRTNIPLSRVFKIRVKEDGIIESSNISLLDPIEFPYFGAYTVYDNKLYSYGGKLMEVENSDLTIVDPELKNWTKKHSTNSVPPPLSEASLVVYKDHLWLFGGMIYSKGQLKNKLYCLKLESKKSDSDTKSYLLDSSKEILCKMVNNRLYADVAFETRQGYVFAHKCILAARISAFRHFFTSQLPESLQVRSDSMLDISTSSMSSSSGYGNSSIQYFYSGRKKIDSIDGEIDVFDMKEHDISTFITALHYIYTGDIEVIKKDIEKLGYVAYDLKLTHILTAIEQKDFDETKRIKEPIKNVLKSFRRMVGNPIGSDIYFVIENKQKMFSHKIFLYMFTFFKQYLCEEPNTKYIEINIKNINIQSFVEYCRLMYSNYSAKATSKKSLIDYEEILKYAEFLGDDISKIFSSNMINNRSIGPLINFAMSLEDQEKQKAIMNELCDYFRKHVSSFVRDKVAVKKCDKKLLDFLKSHSKFNLFNLLDELWYAYHREDDELKDELVDEIRNVINPDNVILILINSHQMGLKDLRSTALDYLLVNADKIERNRDHSPDELSFQSISNLSESLNQEYSNKLRTKMKEQSHVELIVKVGKKRRSTCYICSTDFLSEKKRKCKMCKREAVCHKCLNYKMVLPKVIGIKGEVKICKLCRDLALIIKE